MNPSHVACWCTGDDIKSLCSSEEFCSSQNTRSVRPRSQVEVELDLKLNKINVFIQTVGHKTATKATQSDSAVHLSLTEVVLATFSSLFWFLNQN